MYFLLRKTVAASAFHIVSSNRQYPDVWVGIPSTLVISPEIPNILKSKSLRR